MEQCVATMTSVRIVATSMVVAQRCPDLVAKRGREHPGEPVWCAEFWGLGPGDNACWDMPV